MWQEHESVIKFDVKQIPQIHVIVLINEITDFFTALK